MLNILRRDGICKNVHGFYSCYRPVHVTAPSVGAAPVIASDFPERLVSEMTYYVPTGTFSPAKTGMSDLLCCQEWHLIKTLLQNSILQVEPGHILH